MATKFTANAHFRWCAVSTDVYLLFSVKETGTGFEETFCGAVYKLEPDDDPMAQDEWGVVVRRGTEHCDDTESFAVIVA